MKVNRVLTLETTSLALNHL